MYEKINLIKKAQELNKNYLDSFKTTELKDYDKRKPIRSELKRILSEIHDKYQLSVSDVLNYEIYKE